MKTSLAALVAILTLAACGGTEPTPAAPPSPTLDAATQREETCRQGARAAFRAIVDDDMSTEEGQAAVDKACAGVPAAARSTIIEAEKSAAVMRVMATATP